MAQGNDKTGFLDRTIYRSDPKPGRVEIAGPELWKRSLPIILIGDPGMGKSFLTEAQVAANKSDRRAKASPFIRDTNRSRLEAGQTCLVIYGLDEVAARAEGDAAR